MVRSILIGCLLLGLGMGMPLAAQDNDEYDKWKDMAKEYKKEPLKLRDKIEGYEKALEELEQRLSAFQRDNQQLRSENGELREANNEMATEIQRLRAELEALQEQMAAPEQPQFYVQLGAYQYFDINHYFQNVQCMQVQVDDRLNKYVVGSFYDLELAKRFRDDVRKLGIDDAWVVSVVDGERVTMREALEQLQASGQLTAEEVAEWLTIFPE